MNRRRLFPVVILVLILGLLVWWYWNSRLGQPEPAVKNPSKASDNIATNRPQSKSLASGTSTGVSSAEMQALLNRPDVTPEDKQQLRDNPGLAQRFLQFLSVQDTANSTPLDMYGKVVDQYGEPVVGATISGSVLLNNGPTSKSIKYSTQTNPQGLFSFVGLHGADFGVIPTKPGYEFNYSVNWTKNYKPDPASPMVFTMWKLQGAEPLISDGKFYGINPDGRTYTIDLIRSIKTESASAGGDLLVTIQRPLGNIDPNEKFTWSFSMEAIGGGFIEAHDAYLNEAPEDGYQRKIEIYMQAADPSWNREFQGIFYLKTRDGQVYGHMKIEVIPDYNDTSIFKFESLVNPAGSRNLEYDRTKTVTAGSPKAQMGGQ